MTNLLFGKMISIQSGAHVFDSFEEERSFDDDPTLNPKIRVGYSSMLVLVAQRIQIKFYPKFGVKVFIGSIFG